MNPVSVRALNMSLKPVDVIGDRRTDSLPQLSVRWQDQFGTAMAARFLLFVCAPGVPCEIHQKR